MVRYGRGRVRLLRKHPELLAARLRPGVFLVGCVGGAAAGGSVSARGCVYLAVLGVYAAGRAGIQCWPWASANAPRARRLAAVVFVGHPPGGRCGHTARSWSAAGIDAAPPASNRRCCARPPSCLTSASAAAANRNNLLDDRCRRDSMTPSCPTNPRHAVRQQVDAQRPDHRRGRLLPRLRLRATSSPHQWDDFESARRGQHRSPARHAGRRRRARRRSSSSAGSPSGSRPGARHPARRHEIGCHSYAHRLIYEQTPDEFRADLRRASTCLEDIIGERSRPTARRASRSRGSRSGHSTSWSKKASPSTPASTRRTTTATASPARRWNRTAWQSNAGELWEFPPPVWRPRLSAAGRRRRLLPPLPLRPDAARPAGHQRRRPAVRRLPAPVGDRPRPAAASRRLGRASATTSTCSHRGPR